jgi:ABC-type multidrug transport system fused ATPase/permease subunit
VPPTPQLSRLAATRDLIRYTRRTLGLVFASSPRLLAAMASLTLISAVVPIVVAYAGKHIIDAVVAGDIARSARWVVLELASVTALALSVRGTGLTRSILGARLGVDVNVQILEKAVGLDLQFFENSEFYDKLTRARREASSRPVALVADGFQIVQNLLTLGGYAAVLSRFSGWLVLALLAATVPAALSEMRHSKLGFQLRNWRSPETRRLLYLEYVLANDDHVKEVKLFDLGPHLLGRYRKLSETFYQEDKRLAVRRAAWTQALSLIGTGAFYGAYALMAVQAARGGLTLGTLTLYIVALRQGQQAFQSVLSGISNLYEHNLYMSNLFDFMAMASEATSLAPATPTAALEPAPPAAVRDAASDEMPNDDAASDELAAASAPAPAGALPGLLFENVGFRYAGREAFALRGLSLHVRPGESLAIVGQNGAGKTTLVKLMARLYRPTEGRILLDGVDLEKWPIAALRRRISVLFQDFNQYQLSVRENIGLGSIDHLDDGARIERAAERGGADGVAAALPNGLDARLGTWFEKGSELSGGQWQKIALSRAFMREEADILVLDEPTAALDAEAEHAVFTRFRQLSEGRTTIVISHRFPTVRMARRIIVLEQGTLVEAGSHAELIALGGRYARMFALQAEGYR